jgi:hypothetical protein
MEEKEIKPNEIVKPEIVEQISLGEKLSRNFYVAIMASLKTNCECKTCKIMRKLSDELENYMLKD